jgi:arsenate reductase
MNKPKVAFVCVHNACRSQIAEALGKHLAVDVFESFSAGTQLQERINPDAIRLIKQLYGVDMEQSQYPKLIADIPPVDVVVTMGCNRAVPLYAMQSGEWIGGLTIPRG